MPSVTVRGSLGLVPRRPPVDALAAAVSVATQDRRNELRLSLCPETQPEAGYTVGG